ncbi:hypothetical protein FAI40_04760 [Acetobacteraceae bacterium]|nr:hypothetical protein FAI40_04760 [Acetobacteraceae bacterium]
MKVINKIGLSLALLSFLGGCERAVQTWVFVPDVQRESASQCYKTKGTRLVPWANRIVSEKNLKPLFKSKSLTKAQKKELIYARINDKDEVADKDPMNSRNIGLVLIGLPNLISIPTTSIIAATELSPLKKEYRSCMWKVTVESALQNIALEQAIPADKFQITEIGSEEDLLAKPPKDSSVFAQKHPEDYIPQ